MSGKKTVNVNAPLSGEDSQLYARQLIQTYVALPGSEPCTAEHTYSISYKTAPLPLLGGEIVLVYFTETFHLFLYGG